MKSKLKYLALLFVLSSALFGTVTKVIHGDLTLDTNATEKPVFINKNTSADATSSEIRFQKDSISPADGDDLGRITAYSDTNSANAVQMFELLVEAADITSGSVDASMILKTAVAGTLTDILSVTAGNVGIGTNEPSDKFSVVGNVQVTGNQAITGTLSSGALSATTGTFSSTLSVGGDVTMKNVADDTNIYLKTYSDNASDYPSIYMSKSHVDTIDTDIETENGDVLGNITFFGVTNGNAVNRGADIIVTQVGAAGAWVPNKMEFKTASSTAQFTPLTLTEAGAVEVANALSVGGDSITIVTSQSPASNGTGTQGEIAWDADYIYVCTATNTWKRAALTGGY